MYNYKLIIDDAICMYCFRLLLSNGKPLAHWTANTNDEEWNVEQPDAIRTYFFIFLLEEESTDTVYIYIYIYISFTGFHMAALWKIIPHHSVKMFNLQPSVVNVLGGALSYVGKYEMIVFGISHAHSQVQR